MAALQRPLYAYEFLRCLNRAAANANRPRRWWSPLGLPIEVFDQMRANVLADRAQFFKALSLPFYGYNRPGAKVSDGVRESFWQQCMMAGLPGCYFCIRAYRRAT